MCGTILRSSGGAIVNYITNYSAHSVRIASCWIVAVYGCGDQIRGLKQAEQRSTINPSPPSSLAVGRFGVYQGSYPLGCRSKTHHDGPHSCFLPPITIISIFPKTSFPSAVQPCRGCFDAIIIHTRFPATPLLTRPRRGRGSSSYQYTHLDHGSMIQTYP